MRLSGIALLMLLTTACTTQVTGHVSPIAHDHGVIEWHGLNRVIVQPFVAGPGHQAAIANDGKTTPEQFQQRLAALPEDARTGTLQTIDIGMRLEGANELQGSGRWSTGARVEIVDATGTRLLDRSLDDLPRDGNWLRIDDPPDIPAGSIVNVRIVPGDGPDAQRLRFGVTPDRAPYGGWVATDADGGSAGGALLLRTIYERNIAARSLVTDGLGNLRDGVTSDPVASVFWMLTLAGLLIGSGWVWRTRPARGV